MGRAPCCEKVGLKKGRWSDEEDEMLRKYIEANGEGSWRSLPNNAGLLRCGKSCRLRWMNYLRRGLKRGNISAEEDDVIIKLHASIGNRWSLIASHLPGRTDNEIKNYWKSHLSRQISTFRRPNIETPPLILDLSKLTMSSKRKNSKTSRWGTKNKNKTHTKKDAKFSTEPADVAPSPNQNGEEEEEGMLCSSEVLCPNINVEGDLGCELENLVSWLWESDEEDAESRDKENAMLTWLLS